jgi:hypothetical protein
MLKCIAAIFAILIMLQIHSFAEEKENTENKDDVKKEKPLDENDLMKIIVDFHKFSVKKGSRRINETRAHKLGVEKSLNDKLVNATFNNVRILNDGTTVRFRSDKKKVGKSGKNKVYVDVIIDLKCGTEESAKEIKNIASGKIVGVGISGGCDINDSKTLGITLK